jgi:outer membrane receptor for ferrienterochelin and colicins
LLYEIPEKLKIGLEAYYFSPQLLNDGKTGKSYWTTGLMAEKYGSGSRSSSILKT